MQIGTQLGILALYRCRSSVPSISSAVGGVLEDWKVRLDGRDLAEIRGCAPPGYGMNRQVAHGVQGTLVDSSVAVVGVSSLFSSKRSIKFSSADSAIEFCVKWGKVSVRDGSGEVLARKEISTWNMDRVDMRVFGAIAFVEMAGLGAMLRNPVLAAF
ncbi:MULTISPECIES: hypothetical protein [unclassified Streptomyces]|uniref:hypothetical protein n=1 Tax=unclassified Streptomyces TaxID=2593676 RepID=UPI002E0D25C6|nr:hypothetical protein OG457_26045 [Streptomyces sp. NBC_01207]WTA20278.1 hypothetical protein OG365_20725 [Streptomyces sp. NBC_00853]